jgi:alkane 1-monooxygenase
VFFLVVHPALDTLVGHAGKGRAGSAPAVVGDAQLVVYVAVQTALFFIAIADVRLNRVSDSIFTVASTLGLGLANGAIGMTVAHELVHRKAPWQRAFGLCLLAQVGYMHYRVEHVVGHHARVGTPEDPSTARSGESLYAFLLRVLCDGWRSAWRLEAARLRKGGVSTASARNRLLWYCAVQALVAAGAFALGGRRGLAIFAAQAAIAITLQETTNYIQHYGLVRGRRADGRYAPISNADSWDCWHTLTNAFLFNLGRHAHHHTAADVAYPRLEKVGPNVLPFGYSVMFLLAFVPPLWLRVMGPRVQAISLRTQGG